MRRLICQATSAATRSAAPPAMMKYPQLGPRSPASRVSRMANVPSNGTRVRRSMRSRSSSESETGATA